MDLLNSRVTINLLARTLLYGASFKCIIVINNQLHRLPNAK
jgi:hypothetical protein